MNRLLLTSAVVVLLSGCGLKAPTGTDAEGVSQDNFAYASLRDREWGWCEAPLFDAALQDMMDQYGFQGCAAAFAHGDDIVYMTALGNRTNDDPDTFVAGDALPYTLDTVQPIGSVSKPLTALALLRLAEMGLLDAGDTVEDHLGDAVAHHPAWVRNASIHALLTHTAGIDDFEVTADPDPFCEGCVSLDGESSYVDEDDVGWLDVDWSDWGVSEDPTSGRNPIDAQRILVFPDTPKAQEQYTNVGYLLLGAIIESIVSDDAFTGFEDYPYVDSADFEPTWEAWVWWVFAGQGEVDETNLVTTVLRHPWRQLDGAYPELAVGYNSYVGNATAYDQIEEVAWEAYGDDYGWTAPSGGFMLTIGDLLRLGMQIEAEERIFDSHGYWATAKTDYSGVKGDAYGYGLYHIPNVGAGAWGHGGTIDGFSAGVFAGEFASKNRVIAWQCNATPRNAGEAYEGMHGGVTEALWDATASLSFSAECTPPDSSVPGDPNPLDVLSQDWVDDLRLTFHSLVSRSGLSGALSDVESWLTRDADGAQALAHAEQGDWEAAAECALAYLGDTTTRWNCESKTATTASFSR